MRRVPRTRAGAGVRRGRSAGALMARSDDVHARSSEQAPGPRGSPQARHGPAGSREASDGPRPPTAKTESWRMSSWLLHSGQAGTVEAVTRLSNRFAHSLQTYSKIGMVVKTNR